MSPKRFTVASSTLLKAFESDVNRNLGQGWEIIDQGVAPSDKGSLVLYWAMFTKDVVS